MLKEFFESRTFTDHAGEPSFGRKASFCILVFMGILAVFSLCLVAWLDDTKHAKEVAAHAKNILTWGSGLVGLLYGTAQASKGMAQMGTASTTTATATSTTITAPIVPGAPGPLIAPATTTTATTPQTGGA